MGLFNNFITAFAANQGTKLAFQKEQKRIRNLIEKDIQDAISKFNYSLSYTYSINDIYGETQEKYAKISFIINHKKEFEDIGYTICCKATGLWDITEKECSVPEDLSKNKRISLVLDWG